MIFDGFMMAFALRDVGNARRCLKELERRIEHESSWDSFRNRGSLSSKSLSARLTTLDRAGLILLSNDIKPKTTSTRSSEAPNAILVSTSLRPAPCLAKSSVKVIAKSFDSIRRLSAERLFGRGRVHPEVNNAIYLYGMYHLPNRDYYVQLHGIDHDQLLRMINGVLFYCSLQLVSLFVLFFLLYCLLGLSPIHQLAFVLEKQFSGVQLKLVFWVYYNVQASLQHSGYDYSFKFAWLHRQNVDGEENDFRF
ncbi:hypothetical protein PF010_g8867 [Phytophthora fragariae]|nr:hypothetical protein PF010_g8867 [Phytophthora fragariae]